MSIELQDRLYTSTQVADILGVSLRTLYRYMEDGRIQSMRTASGRHRFTKEQILDFLNANGTNNLPVYNDQPSVGFGSHQVPQNNNQFSNQNFEQHPQYGQMNQPQNQFGTPQVPNQYAGSSNINPNQNNQFAPTTFSGAPMDQQNSSQNLNQYGQPMGQQQAPQFSQYNNPVAPVNQDHQYNQPGMSQPNPVISDFEDDQEDPSDFIVPSAPANQFGNTQQQGNNPYEFNRSDNLGSVPQTNPIQPESQGAQTGWGSVPQGNNQPTQEFQSPAQPETNYYQAPISPVSPTAAPMSNYGGYEAQTQQQQVPSQMQSRPQEPQPAELRSNPSINIRYYRSDFTDLIDLAKRIKSAGLTRDLEYAFTLYAGASLHTPIDPFTILNFYANPEDMQIWKDELRLSPVQKREDSNVGIIVNTDIVFVPTREIGGFKVVDDKVLLKDLTNLNEIDLAAKLRKTFGVL